MKRYLIYLSSITALFLFALFMASPFADYLEKERKEKRISERLTEEERAYFNKIFSAIPCVSEASMYSCSDPMAVQWFEKAKKMQKGLIPGDDDQITELYTKSLKRGHKLAYAELAAHYLKPNIITYDARQQARVLLKKGMEAGIGKCYAIMGNMLNSGRLGSSDRLLGYAYHRKAAELGFTPSITLIGLVLEHHGADEAGIKLLECAAQYGDPVAADRLAFLYSYNHLIYDMNRSLQYDQLGTRLGNYDAAVSLSVHFSKENNETSTPDKERAKRYRLLSDFLEPYAQDRHFNATFMHREAFVSLDQHEATPHILNLDAIVPLPPAELPEWDGTIDADGTIFKVTVEDEPEIEYVDRPGECRVQLWSLPDKKGIVYTGMPYTVYVNGEKGERGVSDRNGMVIFRCEEPLSAYAIEILPSGMRYSVLQSEINTSTGTTETP